MQSGPQTTAITIVVPCYNEEAGLRYLRAKLTDARVLLERQYDVRIILVDDASTDETWEGMIHWFGGEPNCTLVRHASNLGIGGAILTGIREAQTEIVCSIDADCSYDPCELRNLTPLLVSGVDLVTASPYHPRGGVIGVSRWRLLLSKAASFLYRLILRQKLYTYTSCLRVYRRSSILKLNLLRRDFLAIAELLGKLDLQGAVIAECPVVLSTRKYGSSKMKTMRVLFRHFHLLAELLVQRMHQTAFGRSRPFSHSLQNQGLLGANNIND